MTLDSLAMETTALRQQLAVYKRKQPHAKLNRLDLVLGCYSADLEQLV